MINDGEKFNYIASLVRAKPFKVGPTTRFNRVDGIPRGLISKLFDLKNNNKAVFSAGENQYFVARLTKISSVDGQIEKKALETIKKEIKMSMASDILTQFQSAIRKEYKVSIKQNALKQFFSKNEEDDGVLGAAPEVNAIISTYEAGAPQVYWERRVADLETPISAMLKLASDEPYSFPLESVEGGKTRGRYSFIGLKPDLIWRCFQEKAEICRSPRNTKPAHFRMCKDDSLTSLRAILKESEIEMPDEMPPMAAGLVGYMSYDMVRLMEQLPDKNREILGLPSGLFVRPTVIAIFDNIDDTITIVTPVRPSQELSALDALELAKGRILSVWKGLSDASPSPDIVQRLRRNRINSKYVKDGFLSDGKASTRIYSCWRRLPNRS